MKKIVFYIESMVVGGAEKALIDLVNNMDYEKYDVTVITVFKQSVYDGYTFQFEQTFNPQVHYKSLIDNSNTLLYLAFNYLYAHGNRKWIYRYLIKEKYDIEVAFYEGFPTDFVSYSTNTNSKKFAWLHTDNASLYKNKTIEYMNQRRRVYEKYDEVVGVSELVTKSFARIFPGVKCRTIYNFQNVHHILNRSKDESVHIERQATRFLSVGRLIEIKGFDRLIKAANKLSKEGYCFQVIIVGDGSEHNKLKSLIDKFGLGNMIILAGMQQNPYAFMAQSDYFVCSSQVEGFSLVTAEAIICGLPVLATECGGVAEVFGNEKCGIIGENSEDGIYSMMKQVLDHPEQREEYVHACKKRVSFFEPEERIAEFDRLFAGE